MIFVSLEWLLLPELRGEVGRRVVTLELDRRVEVGPAELIELGRRRVTMRRWPGNPALGPLRGEVGRRVVTLELSRRIEVGPAELIELGRRGVTLRRWLGNPAASPKSAE